MENRESSLETYEIFGTAQEYYKFLTDQITDAGSTAMQRILKIAEHERMLEIKTPAIASLVFWGEVGLTEIKNIAIRNTTSKQISAALKILATISAGQEISGSLIFAPHKSTFVACLNSYLKKNDLRISARRILGELVLSLDPFDLLTPMGLAFQLLSFEASDEPSGVAKELISAVSTKWLKFGPPTLAAYQALLHNNVDDEPTFQKFFCAFPQLLDPMAVQVWSEPDFHGALEPDFVIRRADDTYLIVEIERPSKAIITAANQLTAETTHAEKQVSEYKEFLVERMSETRTHFPRFRDPECLVIIGMEGSLNTQQRQALLNANSSRIKTRIVGFDWVLERGQAIISNMGSGDIEVFHGHRII